MRGKLSELFQPLETSFDSDLLSDDIGQNGNQLTDADIAKLKKKAVRVKAFGFLVDLLTAGLFFLIAVFANEIPIFFADLNASTLSIGAYHYVVHIYLFVVAWFAIGFFVTRLIWTKWWTMQATSGAATPRVSALLNISLGYAWARQYSTISTIAGMGGFLFVYNVLTSGTIHWLELLLVSMLSLGLMVLSFMFKNRMRFLGKNFVEHLLFSAVKAQSSTLDNNKAFEQVENRLAPKFKTKWPALYY